MYRTRALSLLLGVGAGECTVALSTESQPKEASGASAAGPPLPNDLRTHFSRSRRLFLTGPVHDDSANLLVAQLLFLEEAQPGVPIELTISSNGGDLYGGFAIHDTIQAISSPVHTICIGRCRSMAAVLLACGEPGHRLAFPNSRIMIHQPTWDSAGKLTLILILTLTLALTLARTRTLTH